MSEKTNEDSHSEGQTSGGSGGRRGVVVHEVEEVFIYIPAEISAAGVDLKIGGIVRIERKNEEFHVVWTPQDLTNQDVACLYSAQADGWTVIDEFVEPPELIESQELSYPDRDYRVGQLEAPDPIIQQSFPASGVASGRGESPRRHSAGGSSKRQSFQNQEEEAKAAGAGVRYSRDGDAHVTGIVSSSGKLPLSPSSPSSSSAGPIRAEAVNFRLSKLHSVREASLHHGKRALTFYLVDGRELPTLYFHDGGMLALLQAMQRYIYFTRDAADLGLHRVRKFDKRKRQDKPKPLVDLEEHEQRRGIDTQVQNVIQGAFGNLLGITRAVRQHFIPDRQLFEVRPGTENEEDIEEKIQTMVCSDVRPGVTPTGTGAGRTRGVATEADPEASLITDFQIITDIRGKLPPRPGTIPRQPPVTMDEWESFRDVEGRINKANEMKFRARVFSGGLDNNKVRKEVWRYLLNYFPFNMTEIERMEVRSRKEKEYWSMKKQWQTFTEDQENRFTKWRDAKQLINKDALRTDRENDLYKDKHAPKLIQLEDILKTYVMYNFDLGYVQGMSDLLAPLLAVIDNEVDAFWCFAGYMDMVQHHFELSQAGMRTRLKQLRALLNVTDPVFYQFLKDKESHNLYFCFRWLLVNFKREFSYEDIMTIWEVIWTNHLSPDYALFIALAIIDREREHLDKPTNDFSDILQHINGLAKKIPVPEVLSAAEVLCRQLGACPNLPEDLQSLVVKPLPRRLETIAETETIMCSPNSHAVPTGEGKS